MASKLPLFLVLPFAISCGGDDTPHTIKTPDSNMGSGSGSGSSTACALNPSYAPALGSDTETQFATDYPSTGSGSDATAHRVGYIAILDDADIADVLYMDLYAGYGGFKGSDAASSEVRAGTYVIANDELNYNDCGICVLAAGDFDLQAKEVSAWYFATAGTVNLTTVTLPVGSAAGRITGSWSGLTLHQVNSNANGGIDPSATPNGDCASQIGDASFDIPLEADTGSATGKPNHLRIPLRVSPPRALHHRYY
jgi:hypothetical protein